MLWVFTPALAPAGPTPDPDVASTAKVVYLEGYAAAKELQSTIGGRGIVETTLAGIVAPEGEVVWQSARDQKDDLGMRHVFYRQYLLPSPDLAKLLGEPYATQGIRLEGAEIGVHSDEEGVYLVYGHGHTRFSLVVRPALVGAKEAFAFAQDRLRERKDFALGEWLTWDPVVLEALQDRTTLTLAPAAEGSFRFVWKVLSLETSGMGLEARMDAATGEILEVGRQVKSDNCRPNLTSNEVTAKVDPQNSLIADRTVWARQADQRLPAWSHEGGRKGTSTIPPIEMFFRINPNPTPGLANPYLAFACNVGGGVLDYGVLPLKTSGAYPLYSDDTVMLPGQGAAAGDALWFTYKTMLTLKNRFSWCGFDGGCSQRANILLDHNNSSGYLGYANWEWAGSGSIPDGQAVVVYLPQAGTYAGSAAMDVIGHEWGHAVVDGSADFPYNPARNQVGDQLDEGFADVLGHSVEWLNQSPGTGAEQADWKFGEDRGPAQPYWRRIYPVDTAHEMKYHKDHDYFENDAYKRGNMLPTVLYMLSEGVRNPLVDAGMCNPSAMPGCDTYVDELGVEAASKILMRTLTRYAPSTTTWDMLANLAKRSAWDLYKNCSLSLCPDRVYDARYEQEAANNAFRAIGFPGNSTYWKCTCPAVPEP